MFTPLSRFISTLGLSAVCLSLGMSATAQMNSANSENVVHLGSPANILEEVLRLESGDFSDNLTFESQINSIFGPGAINRASFSELQLQRDAKLLSIVYQDLFEQQVSSDPIIRTPDLENPYSTSLRLNPSYRALPNNFFSPSPGLLGTEYRFNRPFSE